MKYTLEASTKAQEKQTEALEKLNISTKQRDPDHMFASINLLMEKILKSLIHGLNRL